MKLWKERDASRFCSQSYIIPQQLMNILRRDNKKYSIKDIENKIIATLQLLDIFDVEAPQEKADIFTQIAVRLFEAIYPTIQSSYSSISQSCTEIYNMYQKHEISSSIEQITQILSHEKAIQIHHFLQAVANGLKKHNHAIRRAATHSKNESSAHALHITNV